MARRQVPLEVLKAKLEEYVAEGHLTPAERDDYEIEKVLDYNAQTRKYLVLYTGYWKPEWQSANMVPANLRAAFRAGRA